MKKYNNENPDYIDFSSLFKSNYSLNIEQTEDEYKHKNDSPENLCKILRTNYKK